MDRVLEDSAGVCFENAVKQGYSIRSAESEEDLRAVRRLLVQYAASLAIDLSYQGFGEELANLPGRYAAPHGCLLLASDEAGLALGCGGLKRLGDGVCEMKRLFVMPSARGTGLGRALTLELVEEGVRLRYRKLRLDTLDGMEDAIALYERLGFVRIPAYYGPVPAGTVFMELDLPAAVERTGPRGIPRARG